MNAHLSLSDDGTIVAELIAKLDLLNRVLKAQKNDEKISTIVNQNRVGKETEFTTKKDNKKGWILILYRPGLCT